MIGSALARESLIVGGRAHAVQQGQGIGPHDGLIGLTGSTVTARYGSTIYFYGEDSTTIYAKAA